MASQTVQPLRIQKGGPGTSPNKMNSNPSHGPLAELSPMERRRNSPSFNQMTKNMMNGDSSPFEASPYNPSVEPASPRLFWQGRDPASPGRFGSENSPHGYRDGSPSPTKRSSLEKLKQASRVKNSNMFAREVNREYDPASIPTVERPLAGGRPLSVQPKSNVFGGRGIDTLRTDFGSKDVNVKSTTQERNKITTASPEKAHLSSTAPSFPSNSPSKDKASPTKSSLSKGHRLPFALNGSDSEHDAWSEEDSGTERALPPGRVLHRHAKSVTFDAGPPQVNEYEMTTPEQSSVGTASRESSYDSVRDDTFEDDRSSRDRSIGREDSFDPRLENIDETPVVGPEDWRRMSPATASRNQLQNVEDPFDGEDKSPTPAAVPDALHNVRPNPFRTESSDSTGERRPLPPVPGFTRPTSYSNSPQGLSGVVERRDSVLRTLPSPPAPAATTKSEILGMRGSSMRLEERLRLMMLQDEMGTKSEDHNKAQPDIKDLAARNQDNTTASASMEPQQPQPEELVKEASTFVHQPAPRISRASILRKVKSQSRLIEDSEFNFSSPLSSSTPEHSLISGLDPDTPLPSTETVQVYEDTDTSVIIKQEQDGEADMSSIPEIYNPYFEDAVEEQAGEESVIHHDIPNMDDDDKSNYSQDSVGTQVAYNQEVDAHEDQGTSTPRPHELTTTDHNLAQRQVSNRMSLPEFAHLLGGGDFGLGLQSYMAQPTKAIQDGPEETAEPLLTIEPPFLQRPVTPDHQLLPPALPAMYGPGFEEMEVKASDSAVQPPSHDDPSPEASPVIPEPHATIKARGSKLKTRPSATPADLAVMAAARRQVSGERPNGMVPPPIPERHRSRPSIVSQTQDEPSTDAAPTGTDNVGNHVGSKPDRSRSGRKSLVKLDVPMTSFADDLSLGMDKEFDRVLETQKVAFKLSLAQSNFNSGVSNGSLNHSESTRPTSLYGLADRLPRAQRGYLMRQNTKVVVASSRNDEYALHNVEIPPRRASRSAGNSPMKPSHDRSQSWHVEPWNNGRRKSVRDGSGMPRKKPVDGPVPPLPGQESNVARGLTNVVEEELATEKLEPGVERGRLFVKVVGVRDLNLPLARQPSWFNVTLDNGIHCVQTAWLELGKNAPVGQEFELIVSDDLEFTLTLQTEAPKPPVQQIPESPTKSVKTSKASAFSRVFASPKKRRELERRYQEQDQRAGRQKQQDAQAKKSAGQPTAWDLLHGVVASDGTFARAYFSLKEHEHRAYGRPYSMETDCFNEWATEPATTGSSVKSKRGDVQKRPPYRIGKLELQLLFVPKPKGAQDADMPKSLNACVRELREAETNASRKYEGHLSQQGGDCPYWRRRFFKLDGSKLTAYHETTRQPRATISLSKATKLIDDRSALLQKEVSGKSRRKSAFAEDEEGYMFVEEGFRIRFGNGEIIDFYADSAAEKDGWMKVLGEVVGKEITTGKAWTDLVLARERAFKGQGKANLPPQATRKTSNSSSSSSATTAKMTDGQQVDLAPPTRQAPAPPPPIDKSPRHQHSVSVESTPQINRRTQPAPRSMIF